MQFLTLRDLRLTLEIENINEIVNDQMYLVDEAEAIALENIREYLRKICDIDYELRSIQDYNINVVYNDYDRIRLTHNQSHNDFGNDFNLSLIDSNITCDNESILVKTSNTCPPEKDLIPIASFYYNIENFTTQNDPNYYPTCGIITCSDGTIPTNKIINFYNTIYSGTSGTAQINYSSINVATANTYLGNINNFDQYTLNNINRDFSSDDRNVSLKQLTLDLMKYLLMQRVANRELSQTVVDRYNMAIDKLIRASKGQIQMNLKALPNSVEFQNNSPFRFGWSIQNARFKY